MIICRINNAETVQASSWGLVFLFIWLYKVVTHRIHWHRRTVTDSPFNRKVKTVALCSELGQTHRRRGKICKPSRKRSHQNYGNPFFSSGLLLRMPLCNSSLISAPFVWFSYILHLLDWRLLFRFIWTLHAVVMLSTQSCTYIEEKRQYLCSIIASFSQHKLEITFFVCVCVLRRGLFSWLLWGISLMGDMGDLRGPLAWKLFSNGSGLDICGQSHYINCYVCLHDIEFLKTGQKVTLWRALFHPH